MCCDVSNIRIWDFGFRIWDLNGGTGASDERGLASLTDEGRRLLIVGRQYPSHLLPDRVLLLLGQDDAAMRLVLLQVLGVEPVKVTAIEAKENASLLRCIV